MVPRLDFLEGQLGDGRPFLAGERVTIADCTLAAALQFGRFREIDVLGDRAKLQDWDARYRARSEIDGIMVV
jgi:glutathione S-transferase